MWLRVASASVVTDPEPVCPYVRMVLLYPLNISLMNGCAVCLYTSSCVETKSNTRSKLNLSLPPTETEVQFGSTLETIDAPAAFSPFEGGRKRQATITFVDMAAEEYVYAAEGDVGRSADQRRTRTANCVGHCELASDDESDTPTVHACRSSPPTTVACVRVRAGRQSVVRVVSSAVSDRPTPSLQQVQVAVGEREPTTTPRRNTRIEDKRPATKEKRDKRTGDIEKA